MLDPQRRRVELSALLEAITKLNASVDRLAQFLESRQREVADLARSVEGVLTQSTTLASIIRILQEKGNETASAIDDLVRNHADLTVRFTQLEQRVDDSDQPRGLLAEALRRLAERVTLLEQPRSAPGGAAREARPQPLSPPPALRPGAGAGGAGGSGAGVTLPPATGSGEHRPIDLERRVERLEWKEQTLSRIVQQLVDRALA